MPTTIGMERDLRQMLERLMVLDFDAIEAYKLAASSCEDREIQRTLSAFQADHERHTRELAPLVEELGGTPPSGSEITELFTKGKVLMALPFGDYAILGAMFVNELDTNAAYAMALAHDDLAPAMQEALERAMADERRHRQWIEQQIIAFWQPLAITATGARHARR